MTQEVPHKVFTCLTSPTEDYYRLSHWPSFQLTQFTIDPETEELTVTKMVEDLSFSRLMRLENSKYFLANQGQLQMCLLAIDKDHVEVIHVFSKSVNPFMFDPRHFIMLNDGSIVSINMGHMLRNLGKPAEDMHLYRQEKSKS